MGDLSTDAEEEMLTYAEDLAGRNAVQADYLGMQGVREGPGEVDERLKD